jgi:wyosine [tRNA(Phe)-imidazoG37] synthetase (radical SAM superfamily)
LPGISLQKGIIYGPIFSRRLGRSIGINLLPVNRKVCPFDCVYCQYGRTSLQTDQLDPTLLPSSSDIIAEVKRALLKPRSMDCLTFSGNGEPTVHPNFLEIVKAVKELRDVYRPDIKIALLSNASKINDPRNLSAFDFIDLPMLKLDVGDEVSFKLINRPVKTISFDEVVKGLKSIPNLIVQTLLFDGEISNIKGMVFDNWCDTLALLKPHKIHIYTIARPTAWEGIEPVPASKLEKIRNYLCDNLRLDVEAFHNL